MNLRCVAGENTEMGKFNSLTTRLATLLVLHAAGVGFASPTVLVTRPVSRVLDWLPMDNQTLYKLRDGELRSLELNTSSMLQSHVFITISPCSREVQWALYHGRAGGSDGNLRLVKEYSGGDINVFSTVISQLDRYLLQLSTSRVSAVVVSVRGEAPRPVRLRLLVRSRRRLTANWEASPIDPQETTYCVVASHRKNYTSLCSAQHDANILDIKRLPDEHSRIFESFNISEVTKVNNKIDSGTFNMYEENFKNVYRRKKFGRSTKVTDEDPIIACVGDRTHHLFENLDSSATYFVSVFGMARDRRAGSLLANGSVRPRTSTAKRLKENVPNKADIRGRSLYYFKATLGLGGGMWLIVSTCGGSVDVEVLVRGKRLHLIKNIDPHSKFFVPAPIPTSSIQETSDEGSVQFDSSSEEARMRYVIRVTPSRWDREGTVNVEITASTTRWGPNQPELSVDGSTVRELRPRRSCKSVDIAFLTASHNATDVIRYCIKASESLNSDYYCSSKKWFAKVTCISAVQRSQARVIVHKIMGLKPGTKYAIHVTASSKGATVPYKVVYVDTNDTCKE